MALKIYQTIHIHFIKIGSVTNSSVVQIGTTGSIQAQSDIHNSGGFVEPAEEAEAAGQQVTESDAPLIPPAPI